LCCFPGNRLRRPDEQCTARWRREIWPSGSDTGRVVNQLHTRQSVRCTAETLSVRPELFRDSFITYEKEKGVNHLVPNYTVHALHKLSDKAFRRDCGIVEDNQYLFPSTGGSSDNDSGWHAINCICDKAGVKLNATKVRHLTSTMYAAMDIPKAKRASFHRHMGHSRSINEIIYQTPLAEVEVADVWVSE